MDIRIKASWLTALRSGKYGQTTGVLRSGDRFCCLGVLCDIVAPDKWEGNVYLNEDVVLPLTICDAADLDGDSNPAVRLTVEERQLLFERAGTELSTCDRNVLEKTSTTHLSVLNDHGFTFTEIANIIEREL